MDSDLCNLSPIQPLVRMNMKKIISLLFMLTTFMVFGQKIEKENLTKKKSFYYDKNRVKLQSIGCYYKDNYGETTMKHGKWKYYDPAGLLEEERDYYKDKLNGKVVLFYANKKMRQEGYFKMGQQDSVYREWYETGELKVEGMYDLEKPVGKWKYYYRDGRLKSLEEVIEGEALVLEFYLPDSAHTQTIVDGNGELFDYFTTGSLKEYYQYKDGRKDGSFEEYGVYNYPLLLGNFKEGKKNGEWKYFFFTGDLQKVSHYKMDSLDGSYVMYYDNGKEKVKGSYDFGVQTGHWSWYTNKGTLDMEGDFVDGLQSGLWVFNYPTGELAYTGEFKAGKKNGFWKYLYRNGSKFKEGDFKEDKKDGLWRTWYEDGTLLMEGKYIDGLEEGPWVNNWENGKVKNRSTFTKGLLNGKWESFHQSGRKSLDGEYKDNMKTGVWTTYFENGMPEEIITYKIFNTKSKMEHSVLKDFDRVESLQHGKYMRFSPTDFKLVETGEFNKGEKTGEWIAYHPGGVLPAVVSNYKKGELNGVQKQFDRSGAQVTEIYYKDGLRDGKFLLFDKNGKVVTEKTYKNGIEVIEGTNSGTSFGPGK